jgi:hypothetical protein
MEIYKMLSSYDMRYGLECILSGLESIKNYNNHINKDVDRISDLHISAVSRYIEELKEYKIEPNTPKMQIYCEECDYKLKSMTLKDLIYQLSLDGGYIQFDGEGGFYTCCPKCNKDKLVIQS